MFLMEVLGVERKAVGWVCKMNRGCEEGSRELAFEFLATKLASLK
jgi:hypothetical protein